MIKQIYNINNYVQLDNKLIIKLVIQPILIFVFVLIAVAYFTLAERKIIATVQRRKGPNIVGFAGLLQPLADGLKLFIKLRKFTQLMCYTHVIYSIKKATLKNIAN